MSEWTLDTLKILLDERYAASTKAVDAALAAAKEAVTKAEAATEKRLENVNEFRQTLSDQQKTFVTQSDLHNLAEKMADLKEYVDLGRGSSGSLKNVVGYLTGAAGVIVALVAVLLK